ncbi:winged helix-turn-helix domain-containing protein [Halalkalibacterium halodurans]|uniref:winged helix-turn-helix domain-containing protein n=1 Tax=Halalkalibacterium halodurans TaxID=86665 RepID=UPI0006A98C07|nr:winged helix-turn-helix domain-containing protein [Halalkalibacterium halodurans]TPE70644.1 winged helix-turn-helix transcriptional regulator [Halalkalibacterium halodurans]
MSDTFFRVFSGLLTAEHRKRIGPAIWEFLWCLDRITDEPEENGEKAGIVLYGKPVSYSEVAKETGVGKSTIKRNFEKLEKQGYIRMKRTPYGHVITVRKSKKWGAISGTGAENDTDEGAKNGTESAESGTQGAENGHSNNKKTIQKTITNIATTTKGEPDANEGDGVPLTESVEKADTPESVPVATGQISPHERDRAKLLILQEFVRLRGYGFDWSPDDEKAAIELLDEGVSAEDAIAFMQMRFDTFKPKHRRDRINRLSYCVGFILDKHIQKQEEAVKREKRNQSFSKSRRGYERPPEKGPAAPYSITNGQTGWIGRRRA